MLAPGSLHAPGRRERGDDPQPTTAVSGVRGVLHARMPGGTTIGDGQLDLDGRSLGRGGRADPPGDADGVALQGPGVPDRVGHQLGDDELGVGHELSGDVAGEQPPGDVGTREADCGGPGGQDDRVGGVSVGGRDRHGHLLALVAPGRLEGRGGSTDIASTSLVVVMPGRWSSQPPPGR